MSASEGFLSDLPLFTDFESVADPERYRPLPEGWAMAVADIVDSTGAIEAGNYKAVNMAGAAVISAVSNALGRYDLPFAFGGDGAAVAVPPDAVEMARTALGQVCRWVGDELSLDMRGALVPLADIRAAGHDVRVARFRPSAQVTFAMFAGGGSSWAETQMKAGRFGVPKASSDGRPDLTGLSCRWSPIAAQHGQVVSIIAVPGASGDAAGFAALVSEIVRIAAEEMRGGHPVPATGPGLSFSIRGLLAEARTGTGAAERLKRGLAAAVGATLVYVLYRLNMKAGRFDARQYASDVAMNADFRKFDDGLKMTLDIDDTRLARIEGRLRKAAAEGICRYGLHRQDKALVTCIVPTPLSRDHMHFVDGAAGGYASAARQLKAGAAR